MPTSVRSAGLVVLALAALATGCSGEPTATPPQPSVSVASPPRPTEPTGPTDPTPPAAGRDGTEVAGNPVGLTADGRGGVWVVASRAGTLTHLDRDGEVVAEHPMPGVPLRVTRAYGALWVTRFEDGTLVRVDERTGKVTDEVRVGLGAEGVTAAYGRLWVVAQDDGELVAVDPRRRTVVERVEVGVGARLVTAGAGALFVSQTADGSVLRVDPRTGRARTGPEDCLGAQGLALASGRLWASCTYGEEVVALDPRTLAEDARVPLPGAPDAVVARGREVTVVLQEGPTVVTLDARSGEERDRVQLSQTDQLFDQGNDDAVWSGRTLWVSSFLEDRVRHLP